jgi:hypothetical protein
METDIANGDSDFLIEGAKGYLHVFNTLAAFRRMIQEHCKDCIARNLGDINQAFGLTLTMDSSEPSGAPEALTDNDAKGQWATIGWKVILPNQIGYFDLYLWWDHTLIPGQVAAVSSFRFREKMKGLREFGAVLQPFGYECDDKSWELFIQLKLQPEEMNSIDKILDELLLNALERCRKAPLLKELLGRARVGRQEPPIQM